VQFRKHERADVKLGNKFPGTDEPHELSRGDAFHENSGLRLEIPDAFAGFHEEGVNLVAQPAGARKSARERMHPPRGKAGLLAKLAAATRQGGLPRIDEPCRQFPRECLERRPVLAHDENPAVRREGDDRDVIGLRHGVVEMARGAARKFYLARDDAHPGRDRGGAARPDFWPAHRRNQECRSATLAGPRRSSVVANA